MYTNIFDSHAHYTDKAFNDDRNILLDSLKGSGICGIINCGADLESSKASLLLAEKYDYMYFSAGVHPEEVTDLPVDYIEKIKNMAEHEKCVAIGEIGLDYYWTKETKELQKKVFIGQILLAKELDLPVIVHSRDAHEDTLNILKEYKPTGVLHCFSGSVETAKEILNLGMYIGFGGALTFKNARKAIEVAEMLPLDCLLLETDCPYMAPVPHRGKRNDSSLIPFVAEKFAEIRGIEPQDVINKATENTKSLFNIKD